MIDRDFNVKIIDFGNALYLEGRNKDGLMYTKCGAKAYMTP